MWLLGKIKLSMLHVKELWNLEQVNTGGFHTKLLMFSPDKMQTKSSTTHHPIIITLSFSQKELLSITSLYLNLKLKKTELISRTELNYKQILVSFVGFFDSNKIVWILLFVTLKCYPINISYWFCFEFGCRVLSIYIPFSLHIKCPPLLFNIHQFVLREFILNCLWKLLILTMHWLYHIFNILYQSIYYKGIGENG